MEFHLLLMEGRKEGGKKMLKCSGKKKRKGYICNFVELK